MTPCATWVSTEDAAGGVGCRRRAAHAPIGDAADTGGMANYRTTVTSPASAETAYRYLADFASIIDWDPSVSEAALVSGEPGELGARYRVVVSIPLRTIPLEYEIVEASPPTSANSPAAKNRDFQS